MRSLALVFQQYYHIFACLVLTRDSIIMRAC
jgi:hypothetical protein